MQCIEWFWTKNDEKESEQRSSSQTPHSRGKRIDVVSFHCCFSNIFILLILFLKRIDVVSFHCCFSNIFILLILFYLVQYEKEKDKKYRRFCVDIENFNLFKSGSIEKKFAEKDTEIFCVNFCLKMKKNVIRKVFEKKVISKRSWRKYSFRRWVDIYFPSSSRSSTYSTGPTTSIRY